MRRWTLAIAAAMLALAPASSSAHDIPASVVVQAIVRPHGDRLRLLVRVPLGAMRDVDFPLRNGDLLDLSRTDRSLRDAAMLWLAKDIAVYEGDALLGAPVLGGVRAGSNLNDDQFAQGTRDGLALVAVCDRTASVARLQPALINGLDLVAHRNAGVDAESDRRLPGQTAVGVGTGDDHGKVVRDLTSQLGTDHNRRSASRLLMAKLRVELDPPDFPRLNVGHVQSRTSTSTSAHSTASLW